MERLKERDPELQPPHLPVVISGISGGGKSTIAIKVVESGIIPAAIYNGRWTTRPLRGDGEREGIDGRFGVSKQEFNANRHDFIYSYEKYDDEYAFSRSALHACLQQGNTFVVGGEPNTALPLKENINAEISATAMDMPQLRAIAIYVKRPIGEIIKGIVDRQAPDSEKLKRIAHIASLETHEGHDIAYPVDYEVLNGKNRLQEAVTEVITIIRSERAKQLKELFGSSYTQMNEPMPMGTFTPVTPDYLANSPHTL